MKYAQFTRRTNDPKLLHLQKLLNLAGIVNRRNGETWHAPILEVDSTKLDQAWSILDPIDDIPDNDSQFKF